MSQGHVLIVDDDLVLLQALPEALRIRMAGLTVDTADSAAAALDQITARDYDAIVTDIKIPGMDGLEDRKSTRLNSSHLVISYAVFCLKKKKNNQTSETSHKVKTN